MRRADTVRSSDGDIATTWSTPTAPLGCCGAGPGTGAVEILVARPSSSVLASPRRDHCEHRPTRLGSAQAQDHASELAGVALEREAERLPGGGSVRERDLIDGDRGHAPNRIRSACPAGATARALSWAKVTGS